MALDSTRQLQLDRVEIPASLTPDLLFEEVSDAQEVDITFDSFKDGRGFSLAAILRSKGFSGTLRAVGPLLPDQEDALRRVGFDEVVSERIAAGGRGERVVFDHVYQPDPTGVGSRLPAWRQRALPLSKAR